MRAWLLAAAAAVALVSGCGGVANEPNLAAAVERTEGAGTLRFEVSGEAAFAGEHTRIECSGAVDRPRQRFVLDCVSGSDTYELLVVEGALYVRGSGLVLPEERLGRKWVRSPDSEDDADVMLEEFAPERILELLRAASSDTVRIGEEEVRGVATVRYRLTVDCDRARLACDGSAPVEVWIDEDGLVRRIVFDDEDSEGTIEFFDFGAAVQIEAPPDDDVVDEKSLDEGGFAAPQHPCAESASPISVERATRVLREHGFDVEPDEVGCGPTVAATLTTPLTTRTDEHLSCFVLVDAEGDAVVGVVALGGDYEQIEREHANVLCTLSVERTPHTAVAELDEAFAELRASTGP